jgi:predicted nuclease of predicted toxin-antitoxin system
MLREDGHDVTTVSEAGLGAEPDVRVLEYARQEHRIVLTRNCDEFHDLHLTHPQHSGIFAIYQDREVSKNMPYAAIVRALANLEASGLDFAGQFVSVNAWNY